MENIKCTAQVVGGGEIRNIRIFGIPHAGDLLTHNATGGEDGFEYYQIEKVEHVSGDAAPLPYVLLHVRQVDKP